MILFDARWIGPHGIGRFAIEVMKRLPQVLPVEGKLPPLHPLNPLYLSWLIQRIKPSVFCTPGFNPPLYSSVPFVFAIHDLNHIQFISNPSVFKRAYYDLILKPACRRAFKVLTISEFSRCCIVEWANVPDSKVINVSCGASSNFCPVGAKHKENSPYLFYIGNRKSHKNLPRLFDAYASSGVADDIKLLLSGDADDMTTQMIRTRNLDGKIVFAGLISDSDLPSYYRGAVSLVFPSLYEGFALPVLEAMACGTPVISSDRTAIPEVAGDACLLVNPENTGEIAEAINKVVNDSNLRNKMGLLGVEQSKHFSWDKTAAEIRAVLEQACLLGEKL